MGLPVENFDPILIQQFNLDPIKQAQEIIFTRKIRKEDHPPLVFEQ